MLRVATWLLSLLGHVGGMHLSLPPCDLCTVDTLQFLQNEEKTGFGGEAPGSWHLPGKKAVV